MLGAGSYADLLISASKGSMDAAVKGYVDEGTRIDTQERPRDCLQGRQRP